MLKCIPPRVLISASLALTILWAHPAIADESEAWRYQCLGDESEGTQICTTELAVLEEGDEFIVYFVHTNQGAPPLVVSGEEETIAGASLLVDKNDPILSESCDAGACFFAAERSAELLKQFKKGFRVKVTLQDADARILFDRQMSLRGFSKALVAPPK